MDLVPHIYHEKVRSSRVKCDFWPDLTYVLSPSPCSKSVRSTASTQSSPRLPVAAYRTF